jgi:hypothetical protein
MPYSITVENQVVRVALTGCITAGDLAALAAESKNYEHEVAVVPHRITDMTGIEELAIHYPDVSALAATRGQCRFPNAFKSAIIASSVNHLGYARMFQTLNDNPQIAVRIFPDEVSANEWIAGPGNFVQGEGARNSSASNR